MTWRNKIEQLIGLLEKVPQPKSFESREGVYEPYFIIELRANNWEIIPFASYTRLDGSPGREIRLSLAVIDTSKVNISQNELDCLIYLQSNNDGKPGFNYTQPVGFLLNWLAKSRVLVKQLNQKAPVPAIFAPEEARITLQLQRSKHGFALQPVLMTPHQQIVIDKPAPILTSNPTYLLYENTFYRIESRLPAAFWNNYLRIRETFEIPDEELEDFVRIYLPHLLPVLDWENISQILKRSKFPLSEKIIYLSEEDSQLNVLVEFHYGPFHFPAYPATEHGLATHNNQLFLVERDKAKEDALRQVLEENGLIYRGGHWHIASDYYVLDWMRLKLPKLKKQGFKIVGEENLQKYRVHHENPALLIKTTFKNNRLELRYQFQVGKKRVEIADLPRQLASGKQYLKLADGSYVYFPQPMFEKVKSLQQYLDLKKTRGKLELTASGIVLLQQLQTIADRVIMDDESRRLLEKYERFQRIQPVEPPDGLRGVLRPYQRSGLDWLYFLHDFHFGGILADDMGLGKTVQVIALLQKLKEEGLLKGPVLIVVPLTLIFNWMEEFQKFAPTIRVLRYSGNRPERRKMVSQFPQVDVIIASYGIVLQDIKELSGMEFDYLILDESQKIKNPRTKTYRAIKKLKSRHRLALTGTPVENSLVDLWAQFNFINPGMLGEHAQFIARYLEAEPEEQPARREALKKIIYPFILRRTKEQVETQLPPRTEIIQPVEMTPRQEKIYQKWLQFYRDQIFNQIDKEGLSKSRLKIVEALTYLRQIACHPAILDDTVGLDESGKVQLLTDMLDDILEEGHKVLIFSQFVRFLKLVRTIFDENGWRYEYLDGQVRNRSERIHNFQENPEIRAFLISLKAGGLGINLTAADYVILLDPWWNPAVEQQATDRAHRIGQDKRVFVYKYIVKNSVEEKVLQLQQQKKALFKEMITSESGFVKQLTREDLEKLFELAL